MDKFGPVRELAQSLGWSSVEVRMVREGAGAVRCYCRLGALDVGSSVVEYMTAWMDFSPAFLNFDCNDELFVEVFCAMVRRHHSKALAEYARA